MAKLSQSQIKIVTFIDQSFWENGHIPDDEAVAEATGCSLNLIRGSWKNPIFRNALVARGMDLSSLSINKNQGLLSPLQAMVANAVLNASDTRSVRAKLKDLEVTTTQYHTWLKSPVFNAYIKKRAEDLFASSDHLAYMNVIQNVADGDLNAAKFMMEVRGIYNPKVTVDINIEVVARQFVEIVARHVTDERVLEAIADDLLLTMGNQAQAFQNTLPVGNYKPEVIASGEPLIKPDRDELSREDIVAATLVDTTFGTI